MGELYGTCALLAAVLFFVLLQKFESRFGKVDKELGEIKKRMDDLLKAQEKMASGPVRAKEDVTAETLDNTDILPYVTEGFFVYIAGLFPPTSYKIKPFFCSSEEVEQGSHSSLNPYFFIPPPTSPP